MNTAEIQKYKTTTGVHFYQNAVPLPLRAHMSQERWDEFVQELNNSKRSEPPVRHPAFIGVSTFLGGMFWLLLCAIAACNVPDPSSSISIVGIGVFGVLLCLIFGSHLICYTDHLPWGENFARLATACNTMNRSADMIAAQAELTLREDGGIFVTVQK